MSQQTKKQFKQKYINQTVRITTKNNRIFQGTLKAIDFRSNLIIHNAVAEIPDEQNCPLNEELSTIYDSKLNYLPDKTKLQGLDEKERERERRKYFGKHYFIGAIMISGEDISTVQVRYPLLKETQGGKNDEDKGKKEEKQQVKPSN